MSNWKIAFNCLGCHGWHTLNMEPSTYREYREGNKQALRGYKQGDRDLVNNGIHPECVGKSSEGMTIR